MFTLYEEVDDPSMSQVEDHLQFLLQYFEYNHLFDHIIHQNYICSAAGTFPKMCGSSKNSFSYIADRSYLLLLPCRVPLVELNT